MLPTTFECIACGLHISGISKLSACGLGDAFMAKSTYSAAEFFGLGDEMGTVEEGRLADLVLLSANPLEDISATRAVEAVVLRGSLVSPTSRR